ncbi:Formin-binding protein 1 [Taenia crassiceps]|uniref:Formin-binding protein 1 n=1 Tax=Taenia crassiceps TaxID=6207 RepID=A0ABR4QNR5_9CEST
MLILMLLLCAQPIGESASLEAVFMKIREYSLCDDRRTVLGSSTMANGETKQSLEEEKKSLKRWKQDRDRFQNEARYQAKIIDDEIKRFHEKYREVIRSKGEYNRVDEDKTYSKLDVERALQIYTQKHDEFKRARSDYTAALKQFNFHRRYHYSTTLKNWGEAGQTLEAYRITKTREMIGVLVERLRVMIDRLLTVCTDLEAAVAMMDAEKDSAALIECLRTGNEPPGDVPITRLEVDDPPCTPSRSSIDHGGSTHLSENSDNGINYAPVPVSPGPSANGSPFIGADPIVEPTETHRLATGSATSYPSLSRTGRRFSMSSTGLGSNGNGSAHSTFLGKVFSRRSKSREAERRLATTPQIVRVSGSQPHHDQSTKKPEIVHVDHDKAKETVANASDTSDGELEAKGGRDQQQSIPNLSLLSASVFKSSESTQDMAPAINELSRSLSAPSSSGNSACVHKNAPSRSPAVALPETQIFGCEKNESFKNTSSYGTQISRGTMGGAVPSSHTVHQKAPRSISPRQAIHQPKRQHGGNHQTRKPHPEMKPCHQSTINDLIAVGTCKALYDFESSQYGETFLSFKSGDELKVISSGARWHGSVDAEGWIYAETIPSGEGNRNLPQRGFIPAGFVEIILYPEPLPLSPPRQHEPDDLASHRRVHGYGRTENAYLALGQATEL